MTKLELLGQAALQYIEAHWMHGKLLKKMASKLRSHPSDLERAVHRLTGKRIKQIVDEKRKEELLRRIQHGNCRASQCAVDFGFENDQSFYRWVKRNFRMRWRELLSNQTDKTGETNISKKDSKKSHQERTHKKITKKIP
jgi:methylphosphotriester-DNA--protein-cysteine methyltransferase